MKFVLKKMRINDIFYNTLNTDEITSKKPNPKIYKFAINKFGIKSSDNIYFFEDTPENLSTAKELGWNTVFIGDWDKMFKKNTPYIDFYFRKIEDALIFFISKSKIE